ncbi:Hypothetical predicted protein [Olea europaea subsp. europaea]|uniref:DUF7745 domain-containing protein n=1 Tax=Olea europaea subsp. europaea TaxID=158383 RepID=A0A8S0PPE0_OLEEU|nr:Hypothetical predicted protein [Olea europaea subsp. europaea]
MLLEFLAIISTSFAPSGLNILFLEKEKIKQRAKNLSLHDCQTFHATYGNLTWLLRVKVHCSLIEALISASDREGVCFHFGSFELVPTLKEFSRLLGLSHDTDMLMLPFSCGEKRDMSYVLGIRCSKL